MSGDQNKGPIYGVELYDQMPILDDGWSQAFPGPEELGRVRKKVGDRTVAALEVLTRHHRALDAAIKRSGFDVSPCGSCGAAVVCVPDGLAMCRKCATETESVFDESVKAAEETWYYEDELPSGYDYEANFDRSKVVDGVRMFPAIPKAAS